MPPMGGINLHGSVLPKYRGAAPVARAIQHGEAETGVTVIRMTPRVDAGGMIAVARDADRPRRDGRRAGGPARRARRPAGRRRASPGWPTGTAEILPQDPALATKAPKLRKEDGVIDWSRSARQVHDLVRAMQPWPIASTSLAPLEPRQGRRSG